MALSVPICDGGTLMAVGSAIECVGGTWVVYDGSALPGAFDLAQLDPERLAGFYGAGFVLAATPILVGLGCKFLLDAIRGD